MHVLLINPSVPYSVWTFSETLELMGKKAFVAPLGIITVAALLPEEWELRLADNRFQPITDDLWDWADMIMISSMLVQRPATLRVVEGARARGKRVVVGGPYPTVSPDELIGAGADFVGRVEAETVIGQFLEMHDKDDAPTVLQTNARPDMAASPIPRFDLREMDACVAMAVQTSRGCPFNCEFCDVASLYGRELRHKNHGQVIMELDLLYSYRWRGSVLVSDDNFIAGRKHARDLLDELVPWMESHGRPFDFWSQASIDLGQAPELMDKMAQAGFSHLVMGLETPDTEVLAFSRKHQNITNPLVEWVNNINVSGITVVSTLVIGFDNETGSAGGKICDLVERTNIPIPVVNKREALPGTDLWRRLKREKRLIETHPSGDFVRGGMNFVPSRPAAEVLEDQARTIDRLYEPSAYLTRAYRYYAAMRPARLASPSQMGGRVAWGGVFSKRSFRKIASDLVVLVRLARRYGAAPYRWQALKYVAAIALRKPSRLPDYIQALASGENLYALREVVLEDLRAGRLTSVKVRPLEARRIHERSVPSSGTGSS